MDERAVQGKKTAGTRGSTRSIAFVALTIALMGVSAWVAIPFGPVMLTLQMFALMFALLALTPRECLAAIAGYLALGAVGLPMFSGMRGGIGMLLGPTGGYRWGYVVAAAVALAVRAALRRALGGGAAGKKLAGGRAWAVDLAACLVFIIVTYTCGCVQYAAVVGVDLAAAFAVTIAPEVGGRFSCDSVGEAVGERGGALSAGGISRLRSVWRIRRCRRARVPTPRTPRRRW